MSDTTQLEALVKQREPAHQSEGSLGKLQATKLGQLFTADWKYRLLQAGCCYDVTVGNLANAGGAPALITGGGGVTTIDSDRPELIVGVTTGWYMIPLVCDVTCSVDLDADAEIAEIIFFADTTQVVDATGITGTAETPSPLLGGGKASVARAWSAVTADLTDPVSSISLAHRRIRAMDAGTVASQQVADLFLHWEDSLPPVLKGPAQCVVCWGGTAAVPGTATLKWAEIPASWVEGF